MTQLYIECPCTSFPRSFARDYKETYLYPPPSTIYGFLLSLIGEEDLTTHLGVKLAIGIIGDDPPISRIVRKQRHHKFAIGQEAKKRIAKYGEGIYPTSNFSKPNHQELLTELRIVVQVNSHEDSAPVKLTERISIALLTPSQITRSGGLSLGESNGLVNGVRTYRESDGVIRWLVKDRRGLIGLPIWINRTTGQGTFQRFSFGNFCPDCWISIKLPISEPNTKSTKSKKSK
ncbi:CRISPR-associated protein Cas5 [Nostoc sphaeroides CHAB 2801]|uniref:CRISPR-associated protein Cas5 n=1 Tax=Nostoc sphaeroides TaxID=446679 RepID=UPI001E4A498B|nr:CRISPR-associated protein Cas5 [Nostoc sphaeroides]MCC5633230.1 CRISPR-associated protein Cas5 [Nostoc sphaeroides CHAB 2801]